MAKVKIDRGPAVRKELDELQWIAQTVSGTFVTSGKFFIQANYCQLTTGIDVHQSWGDPIPQLVRVSAPVGGILTVNVGNTPALIYTGSAIFTSASQINSTPSSGAPTTGGATTPTSIPALSGGGIRATIENNIAGQSSLNPLPWLYSNPGSLAHGITPNGGITSDNWLPNAPTYNNVPLLKAQFVPTSQILPSHGLQFDEWGQGSTNSGGIQAVNFTTNNSTSTKSNQTALKPLAYIPLLTTPGVQTFDTDAFIIVGTVTPDFTGPDCPTALVVGELSEQIGAGPFVPVTTSTKTVRDLNWALWCPISMYSNAYQFKLSLYLPSYNVPSAPSSTLLFTVVTADQGGGAGSARFAVSRGRLLPAALALQTQAFKISL